MYPLIEDDEITTEEVYAEINGALMEYLKNREEN